MLCHHLPRGMRPVPLHFQPLAVPQVSICRLSASTPFLLQPRTTSIPKPRLLLPPTSPHSSFKPTPISTPKPPLRFQPSTTSLPVHSRLQLPHPTALFLPSSFPLPSLPSLSPPLTQQTYHPPSPSHPPTSYTSPRIPSLVIALTPKPATPPAILALSRASSTLYEHAFGDVPAGCFYYPLSS